MDSNAFKGIFEMAMFGFYCLIALFVAALIGIPILIWWLCQHVTIGWV